MAYNKSSKRKSKYAIGAPKGKTPSRSCNLRKGVLFSAYGPSAIRQATCRCSRTLHLLRRTEQKKKYTPLGNTPLLPSLVDWAGRAAGLLYHIIRQKDTGNEAASRTFLQRKGSPSYNLSVSLRSTAPLVGESLAKPFTLRGLPKPPLLGEVARRRRDGEVGQRAGL